jgi:hypothetical protein
MMTGSHQELVLENTNSLLTDWIPDIIGCFGTIIVLIAYLLLQARKLNSHSVLFSVLNLVGGLLILVSLLYCWNLAAVAMEVSWVIISSFGLIKVLFSQGLRTNQRTLRKENT